MSDDLDAARALVRIEPCGENFEVVLGSRRYLFTNEEEAVIEREWWMEFLAAALRERERAVWDKVAMKVDALFLVCDHRLDNVRDARVDTLYKWICQQAQEGR